MNNICTIDSNIWLLNFAKNNKGHLNVNTWFRDNLENYEKIKLSTIIPLEVLHNLSKDPRIDYEIPFSYVVSMISLEKVELVDFNDIQLSSVLNKFAKWRMLGIGGRDTAILNVLDPGETILTHDKNMLMNTEFHRIDPFFDQPLVYEAGQEFDIQEWNDIIENK